MQEETRRRHTDNNNNNNSNKNGGITERRRYIWQTSTRYISYSHSISTTGARKEPPIRFHLIDSRIACFLVVVVVISSVVLLLFFTSSSSFSLSNLC